MRNIFIIILFLLNSCGYQPIYVGKNTKNFSFNEIVFEGNNKINEKIANVLNFEEKNSENNYEKIILNSEKTIIETSKDSKGQILSYKTTIKVSLRIENRGKKIKDKVFTDYFSYNTRDNKFELVEYQNQVENNLTKTIIEEIFLYLNI